jgi:hypothetical protein
LITQKFAELSTPGKGRFSKSLLNGSTLIGLSSFLQLVGDCLVDVGILKTVFAYWATALVIATYTCYHRVHIIGGQMVIMVSDEQVRQLSSLSVVVTLLVGLMIGMFVSTMVGRWSKMRTECLGGLRDAIDELIMRLSVLHIQNPSDCAVKERILRLCKLCHRLLYLHYRRNKHDDLRSLLGTGLLSKQEFAALKDVDAKAQVVWMWIGRLIRTLEQTEKVHSPKTMEMISELSDRALLKIGSLYAYVDVQVPRAYTNILTLSVVCNNILCACKVGFVVGVQVSLQIGPLSQSSLFGTPIQGAQWTMLLVCQFAHLIVVPFFYHAFVKVCTSLANPLDDEFLDFPDSTASYGAVRDEVSEFITAVDRIKNSNSVLEYV